MRQFVSLIAVVFMMVPALAQQKPTVRAITAFVRLDRAQYQREVRDTLAFLRRAKAAFEQRGYQVESVRMTTQPFPDLVRGLKHDEALAFLLSYDELAQQEGFDTSLGPAMLSDADDPGMAKLLAEALASAKVLEGSIIIAAGDGIHWKAISAAADVIKYLEAHSPHSQGNFNFAATAMLPPLAPFYPGSYHTGAGHRFAIGLESANVVAEAFASVSGFDGAAQELTTRLGRFAQDIQSAAQTIAAQTGWSYAGLDLSPAPLKDVSIGAAIEKLTHARFGSSGTMSAVAAITAALKAIPVKQAGYSGLMLPILEDSLLAQRWSEGAISIDALLAYSAVCGTGLDTVPLPGEITREQLGRMLADVASLARKWNKPLSARLLPVAGKKPGERTEFDDPFLVNSALQPLP
ncbi:MAG: DUF711 family protein [Acidobacteriia bacterium]|nr:DUF711 family protein [Terriglobia bacterium]